MRIVRMTSLAFNRKRTIALGLIRRRDCDKVIITYFGKDSVEMVPAGITMKKRRRQ